jgi:hypothetical protein
LRHLKSFKRWVQVFEFSADKVRANAREATTDDLLNRVTVYRSGMQPEAIQIIEEELRQRGVGPIEIHAHRAQAEQDLLFDSDGLPLTCSFCSSPAVVRQRGWHRVFGKLPLFPRWYRYCKVHRPEEPAS